MSSLVFPSLQGLKWDRKKTPEWSTKIQRTASGKEARVSFFSTPLYNFSLTYEFLRTDSAIDELKSLVQLFNQCKGSFDTFLYCDEYDVALNERIGVGDGATTSFQLIRTQYGFNETILNPSYEFSLQTIGEVNLISEIASFTDLKFYVNGIENYHNSLSSSGVLMFNFPPLPGAIISWSGHLYYKCRFKQDEIEFNNFMINLWEAKKVEFVSVKE